MPVSLSKLAVAGGVGYLLGTVPTADIVSRAASSGSIDLRETGSGNPGTLNALKVLGKRAGATVLAGDFAKGGLAVGAGRMIAGDAGACFAGSAAVAGHNWPVWNGFRGGKGVATASGTCLALFPSAFPLLASSLAAGLAASRSTERAVQVAGSTWIGATVLWVVARRDNGWGPHPGPGLILNATATTGMVLAKFAGRERLRPSSLSRRRRG